jgi:hypothetical protein
MSTATARARSAALAASLINIDDLNRKEVALSWLSRIRDRCDACGAIARARLGQEPIRQSEVES